MRRLATLLLLLTGAGQAARPFPHTDCETLSGNKIAFPDAVAGSPALIVMGFTRDSRKQVEEWSKRAQAELAPGAVFTAVVLEAAPRLIRGMITRNIRNSIPRDQYDRFTLIFQNEDELKSAAGFGPGADAYLLLLDRRGQIFWKYHGKQTDAAIAEMKAAFSRVP